MNRDEFTRLPSALALGLVWDHLELERHLGGVEAPKAPRAPKYDSRVYRKEGVQYASEMDLDGLIWWQGRAQESAASGGQYAEKDAKQAERLGRWIAWRSVEPEAQWTGVRDDSEVTAEPPLARPKVYPKGEPTPGAAPKHTSKEWPEESGDMEDLPFAVNVSCEEGERWWRL